MTEAHPLFTIGYTKKTAEEFFSLLEHNQVDVVVDVRASNSSQLAAFTKRSDLPFFLDRVARIGYRHFEFFAPTQEIRDTLKRSDQGWPEYERRFNRLLVERDVIAQVDKDLILTRACCLLCAEPAPDRCHRRLVAEHLAAHLQNLEIRHL